MDLRFYLTKIGSSMTEEENKARLTKEITNHIREMEALDVMIDKLQMLRKHHTECMHGCLDEVRTVLNQPMPSIGVIPLTGGTNKD